MHTLVATMVIEDAWHFIVWYVRQLSSVHGLYFVWSGSRCRMLDTPCVGLHRSSLAISAGFIDPSAWYLDMIQGARCKLLVLEQKYAEHCDVMGSQSCSSQHQKGWSTLLW